MSAAGKGTDAANLSDTERARWREQARQWLQAELASKTKILDSGSATDRMLAMDSLASWFTDSDLAVIRDSKELSQLPAAERAQCQKLWAAVGAALRGKREANR